MAINQPYVTHIWREPGDHLVSLWAFNESHTDGVSATLTIHVAARPVLYVAATSTNPQPPYSSWATAATNIQAAVDVATLPGALVLVTNGAYGGTVSVSMALAIRSVNGPQVTVISGGGTNPCVYLSDGASLTGFTLTDGYTRYTPGLGGIGGSGVSCASTEAYLTNCVIAGNSAYGGGGVLGGTLYNCTLTGNSSVRGTGGALISTLYNCVLTGNSGFASGGAEWCTLYNCTVSGNSDSGAVWSTLNNCTVSGNSDSGAWGCTLHNCTLSGNRRRGLRLHSEQLHRLFQFGPQWGQL